MTLFICAQIGTGHTDVSEDKSLNAVNLEPSSFQWGQSDATCLDEIPHLTTWPNNYCDAAIALMSNTSIVLMSSHSIVVQEMVRRGARVTLVYPDETQKEDYRARLQQMGLGANIVDVCTDLFDTWVAEARAQTGCRHIVLSKGQFLKDIIG